MWWNRNEKESIKHIKFLTFEVHEGNNIVEFESGLIIAMRREDVKQVWQDKGTGKWGITDHLDRQFVIGIQHGSNKLMNEAIKELEWDPKWVGLF